MDLGDRIREINAQLERVKIRQKGNCLYLRATFPPKPGDGDRPKQYELGTNCNTTLSGLKIAKAKAQEIESLLTREKFEWGPYLKGKSKPPETAGQWIERYEANHWKLTPRTPTKENTYRKDYQQKFNRLPPDQPLTAVLLENTILKQTKPGSNSRKKFCVAYRRLAEFAGITGVNFQALAAGYAPQPISPESLPVDEKIKAVRESIKNPAWKWVYSMLAVYGLRPHEIFHLDTSRLEESPGIVKVLSGTKTGARLVWPCPAAWWEEFEVWKVQYPNIRVEGRNNNELGTKVSQEFRGLKIGFNPYSLRHAYAIRTAVLGVDVAIAAKWMGHSVTVHTKTYHQAISEAHHQRVFELMKRREQQMREY